MTRIKFALFNRASYTHLFSSGTSNKITSCQFPRWSVSPCCCVGPRFACLLSSFFPLRLSANETGHPLLRRQPALLNQPSRPALPPPRRRKNQRRFHR